MQSDYEQPTRIDAPAKIIEAVQNAQRTVERINQEVQAMEFGARVALDVPDGWLWDGSGWIAPDNEKSPVG